MHTFAAVTYDRLTDQLVVASYPQHLEPGRFTDVIAHVWPKIRRHPTWLFDIGAKRWRPLESAAVHFFPHATAYDSHRAVVMGYRPDGIYELPMSEANRRGVRWRQLRTPPITQTPSTTRAKGSSSAGRPQSSRAYARCGRSRGPRHCAGTSCPSPFPGLGRHGKRARRSVTGSRCSSSRSTSDASSRVPRSARSAFHTDSGSPLAATHNWGERNLRDSS